MKDGCLLSLLCPSCSHFLISPLTGLFRIDANNDVVVVMQNGKGAQVNRKDRRKVFDAIHNPLTAVFKIKTGLRVFAAQESSAHAA